MIEVDVVTLVNIINILLIIFAILAAEHKNLGYSILSLFIITILTAILFYVVGAIFVSVVQLAVFSGAIMIFFIMVFVMTRGGVSGE